MINDYQYANEFDQQKFRVALDKSGNGNHGQILGAKYCKGIVGESALVGDGISNYVSIPDSDLFSISTANALSVSFWFNPQENTTGYTHPIGKGYGSNYEWYFRYSSIDNSFRVVVASLNGVTEIMKLYNNLNFNTGWYHIVSTFSYDGANITITLYVNNSAQTPLTQAVTIGNGNSDLQFFHRNDARYFTGSLDEVRIYNKVLSTDEINTLYNKGNVTDGLVGYWDFEEFKPTISASVPQEDDRKKYHDDNQPTIIVNPTLAVKRL